MDIAGSVLIADDEESFRLSTAELLRSDGYACDCAADGQSALDRLRSRCYDVLLADIRMEGNTKLELVRGAQQLAPGMPVVLMTGFPSLDTAIDSVHLPVAAYLMKPLNYSEMREQVKRAIEQSRTHRAIDGIRERLEESLRELGKSQDDAAGSNPLELIPKSLLRTLASCLSDLLQLRASLGCDSSRVTLCELLDCSAYPTHHEAIIETIEVLKRTKSSFKSKELANLRSQLEGLL
jgi:FixJ family two-component response regulator